MLLIILPTTSIQIRDYLFFLDWKSFIHIKRMEFPSSQCRRTLVCCNPLNLGPWVIDVDTHSVVVSQDCPPPPRPQLIHTMRNHQGRLALSLSLSFRLICTESVTRIRNPCCTTAPPPPASTSGYGPSTTNTKLQDLYCCSYQQHAAQLRRMCNA